MNDIIKNLTKAKLLDPLFLKVPRKEGQPFSMVEYALQWAIETDPIRSEVISEMEAETPMAYNSNGGIGAHIDRIENFILPSLFSKLHIVNEEGDRVKYVPPPELTKPILDMVRKFFEAPKEKIMVLADLEVTKSEPIAYVCFWLNLRSAEDVEIEDFFHLDDHTLFGQGFIQLYAKVAVAADNEDKFRFLNDEELKSLLG